MEISLETREFIRTHRDDDVRDLALHAKAGDDVDLTTALEQIDGWQRARTKLPEWAAHDDIIYPPHLSMEQCSSQTTALYKTAVAQRLAAQRLVAQRPVTQRLTAQRAGRDGKPNATNDTPDDETARTAATGTNTPTTDTNTTDTVTTLIDLTGGFGVDFSYMARAFTRGVYVERQGALCEIARHNTAVLGLGDVTMVNTDATDYLMRMDADGTTDDATSHATPDATSHATPGATSHATSGVTLDATNDPASTMIFIDPARRDAHGGRTYAIADCTPDVLALKDVMLERAAIVMVKLSPMLDWRKAVRDLGGSSTVREVHIVSTGNECKELLIVLGRADAGDDGTGHDNADFDTNDDPRGRIRMYCVNDGDVVDYLVGDDLNDTIAYADADTPRYVFEPNASIMKAGCFALIERRYGVRQIGPNSHLFVSELPVADFPGRGFAVDAMTGMGKRELKTALGGVTHANIATRNFPMTVAALRKKLRLKDGGDTYIFATTDARRRHVLLVTRKMPADQGGAAAPHWS
nr:SAM-dependent methyltransferase [Bifidobacterium catulorum]